VNVLITARLSDEKLKSKLVGLQSLGSIKNIYLVRISPLCGSNIININPPLFFSKAGILFEIWRFITLLKFTILKKPGCIVGIQFFMHGFSAILVGMLTMTPSVIWLIGSDVMVYGRKPLIRTFFQFFVNKASCVLVMGTEMAGRLVDVPRARIFEMQSFIDPDVFNCKYDIKKRWELGFFGNLVDVKNVELLIEVVQLLQARGLRCKTVIAGTGDREKYLKDLACKKEVNHLVEFVGHQKDIAKFINRVKIVVLTSKSEGLPAILLESSFCAVPAISSDVGEIGEYFRGYDNVVTVDKRGGSTAVANEIERLLCDDAEYSKRVKSAKRFRSAYIERWGREGQTKEWDMVIKRARYH